MGRISTQLKIAFFGLLLAGFIVIQYCWVQSLQKDRLEEFRSGIVTGIHSAVRGFSLSGSMYGLKESTLAKALSRSFSAKGLGNIPFEFSIASNGDQLASHGFDQKLLNDSSNLVMRYMMPEKEGKSDVLIVVIPLWEKFALKGMIWIIAASLLLTVMMLVIFCYTSILVGRKQQLLYESRTDVIKKMMQQLETPLSTVSVAAEALRSTRLMHDPGKINYYQQVINEENKRMNEQVNIILRDLE